MVARIPAAGSRKVERSATNMPFSLGGDGEQVDPEKAGSHGAHALPDKNLCARAKPF